MIFLNYLVFNIKVCIITQTQIFIPVILFLAKKKMVKKEYYGNESFGLAWDCVKVHQIGPFSATKMVKKLSKCL